MEIFAGKAGLSRRVRRRRKLAVMPPIEVEISEEVQCPADMLDPLVEKKLENWIRSGVVQFVHFGTSYTLIDSEAVEGALIKGYSGAEDVCELVGLFWDLAAALKCSICIDRVPTDANPADYPSRNDLQKGREAGWETAEISWPDELV